MAEHGRLTVIYCTTTVSYFTFAVDLLLYMIPEPSKLRFPQLLYTACTTTTQLMASPVSVCTFTGAGPKLHSHSVSEPRDIDDRREGCPSFPPKPSSSFEISCQSSQSPRIF